MTTGKSPITNYQLPISGILLLATAARFFRLGAQSLWSDEGNSVALAHRSFAEIAIRTAHDIHPPLYYWLLKIWVAAWGDSEFAVRALSAALGVLLVAVIFRLGARWFDGGGGVAAALLAAVNPFQVYYAQEARMYMLLALLGALTAFFAAEYWRRGENRWLAGYALVAAAGLYTHYAFPVMLAAVNVAALFFLWNRKHRLLVWLAAQLMPLALFSPWLPIAFRQLTTWPQSLLTPATPAEKLLTIGQTLAFGVAGSAVDSRWLGVVWGVLLVVWLEILVRYIVFSVQDSKFKVQSSKFKVWRSRFKVQGSKSKVQSPKSYDSPFAIRYSLFAIRHSLLAIRYSLFVFLWLLFPVTLTFFLFRPAYLKFLLIASPAFGLFLVQGFKVQSSKSHAPYFTRNLLFIIHFSLFIALLIPSVQALNATYFDPAYRRDNYRGIAAYIRALGTADDTVILNAPGQQEVFGYYYRSDDRHARVEPLPQQRPLDAAETVAALENITAQSRRIFGVFWATDEADPDGLIERWLNEHTFKASDVWFGNVRLVQFATESQSLQSLAATAQFGDTIELTGYQLPAAAVAPGDILQVGLRWRAIQSPAKNYTVFVQVLDAENHLVGQRDAAPQKPTSAWAAGETVDDRHGVQIEPGTPPGEYRLVVGLYDAAGRRLSLPAGGDFLELATVTVAKNAAPLPIEAYRIRHRADAPPLVGYNVYKLGHASEPDAPLHPGDPIHFDLYWQATDATGGTVEFRLEGADGTHTLWQGEPVPGYPMHLWQKGEIVRQQLDVVSTGWKPGKYRPVISVDGQTLFSGSPIYIVP